MTGTENAWLSTCKVVKLGEVDEITLVAVSKTHPAERIVPLIEAGRHQVALALCDEPVWVDADALRQLGMLAYDENRLADAERLLRRYTARGPDDYEAHYFLGEALTALKRPAAAAPFYRTALAQLRARGGRGDAAVLTEANLLNRLGKR